MTAKEVITIRFLSKMHFPIPDPLALISNMKPVLELDPVCELPAKIIPSSL